MVRNVAVLCSSTATFLTMGLVAILVYEKLGLTDLRRAWVTFDTVWAVAVCVAGVFTLFNACATGVPAPDVRRRARSVRPAGIEGVPQAVAEVVHP